MKKTISLLISLVIATGSMAAAQPAAQKTVRKFLDICLPGVEDLRRVENTARVNSWYSLGPNNLAMISRPNLTVTKGWLLQKNSEDTLMLTIGKVNNPQKKNITFCSVFSSLTPDEIANEVQKYKKITMVLREKKPYGPIVTYSLQHNVFSLLLLQIHNNTKDKPHISQAILIGVD